MTEQGIHRRAWYLPNTEETEYVIDSHCSEILLHPLQALLPPSASLAHHGIPIVCGEAPVLTLGVSLVGHRSRLHVEIEQRALAPCLNTVGTYSYGYVGHKRNILITSIFCRFLQLIMQYVLHPINIFCLALLHQCLHPSAVIYGILLPIRKTCSVIFVAQDTECSVWHQPILILLLEFGKLLIACQFFLAVGIEFAQVFRLHLLHSLIISERKIVEF